MYSEARRISTRVRIKNKKYVYDRFYDRSENGTLAYDFFTVYIHNTSALLPPHMIWITHRFPNRILISNRVTQE